MILSERDGGIAVLTLNRPTLLNALSLELRRRLAELVAEADADPAVRVLVIRGAGDRAFSAGADISEFREAASLTKSRAERGALNANDAIAAMTKPTIAAIHGFCLGGGLEIALACDVRIASDDAVFGLPEVRLAIIPGAGGTQRLPRLVGVGQALRLILSGERIDAAEALRIGLVTEVVARADLTARTIELAARFSEVGPLAIAYAKEAILRGVEMPIADGLRLEADLATLLTNTADRIEGARAFKEKRKPVFRGE